MITKSMKIACLYCKATGRQPGTQYTRCMLCLGYKELTITGNPSLHACPFCGGTAIQPGTQYTQCELCNGFGRLDEDNNPPTLGEEQPEIPKQGVLTDVSTQDRFFATGSTHDAYVHVRSLLQSASRELFIIDGYLDETIYLTLATIGASPLAIKIMTSNVPPDFGLEGRKFAAQRPGVSLEIRQSRDFHDRFIFVDRTGCYFLGPSIKDAGGRSCAIIELSDAEVVKAIFSHADGIWNSATPL